MDTDSGQKNALWDKIYPEFFSSADSSIGNIISNATRVEVPAGSAIISPGACCEQYLFVVAGRARVQILTESGREIVLYHVGPGDGCVLTTSCLLSQEPFPAGIVAETDIVAFTTTAALFTRAVDASQLFRHFVFRKFGERLVDVVSRMEQVCAPSIDRNLAQILLELANDQAEIETTHNALAQRMGTAREVVSRHLKQFELNGWVHLSRGHIRLTNPEQLQRVLS